MAAKRFLSRPASGPVTARPSTAVTFRLLAKASPPTVVKLTSTPLPAVSLPISSTKSSLRDHHRSHNEASFLVMLLSWSAAPAERVSSSRTKVSTGCAPDTP